MADVELFVAINEDDEYEVSTDEDDAVELLSDNYGSRSVKLYKITLGCLPSPSIEAVEINLDVTTDMLRGESVTVKIG